MPLNEPHNANGHVAASSSSDAARIRTVVVVDGDPLARSATRDALTAGDLLEVVGDAASPEAALKVCAAVTPDLVVVEVDVADDHGRGLIAALGALPSPPRVLPFSRITGTEVMLDTLRAGACGFVHKESGTESLVASVHAVLRDEVAITRVDTMRIVEFLRLARRRASGMRPVRSTLTAREWEIFDLMAAGHTTRAMADKLVLSEATVYSHVKSILRKLDAHSRAEAIAAVEAMSASADRRRRD
ncbi:LuxR C-terminal-related transcriptional regulator [Capillimicrobium parvum]|uniref:Oxygen regulatory protein NreC n=1 Tax=Capillimicrobium parvum TaxID=2884022 RepID=A0A9E7C2H7_9ACTN|nr:response regulator transcription factor [Capillimicrobium parvum]UGS37769.1 Oxygen regulatory protein NreC [Capillimicrobium parvum]